MIRISVTLAIFSLFTQCNEAPDKATSSAAKEAAPVYKTIRTTYSLLSSKDSIKNIKKYFSDDQQHILFAVNRVDADNIGALDTVVVPKDMKGNILQYSPYPQSVSFLKDIY